MVGQKDRLGIMRGFNAHRLGLVVLAGLLLVGAARGEGAETASSTAEAKQEGWEFDLTAYVWGPAIRGTSAVPGAGNTKITLKDILDNLDMTMMLAGEIRKGKWKLYGDMVYLDLESDVDVGPLVEADIGLEAWVADIGGGYRVIDNDDFSLALLAGARYLYIDGSADVLFLNINESQDAWNGIVGFDARYQLPRKWHLYGHLDAGTGETKFTWQALCSVGYHFNKYDAFVGYRHVVWDFDEDDNFGTVYKDLTVSGPYAGVKRKF